MTWAVFGTAYHAENNGNYLKRLLNILGVQESTGNISIELWPRFSHPDGNGRPAEPDFAIYCDDTVVLGEAKWKANVGQGQGSKKDSTQFELRWRLKVPGITKIYQAYVGLVPLSFDRVVSVTWDDVIFGHPFESELRRYLEWRQTFVQYH